MDTQMTPRQSPQRTYRSFYTDSTFWERYTPRPGDIIISTPAKVGTTWTQRITSVLVFQSTELPQPLMALSPWLDCTYVPLDAMVGTIEQQEHRRFIKTHLPMDALPIYAEVSYLIVGRDLRDAAVSTHNHARGLNEVDAFPEFGPGEDVHTPVKPIISDDIRAYWREYFTRSPFPWESNGWPFNSPTHHLESWWEHREEPNILFLHYQDMLDDLDKEMRRVSAFLGIPVNEDIWPGLVKACTFSDMKANKDQVMPEKTKQAFSAFEFFHKGRNGQWLDVFTDEDLALYQATIDALSPDLRAWLTRSA